MQQTDSGFAMTLLGTIGADRPIESLAGEVLNGRWKVIELVRKQSFQTGSCFSVGYVVEDGTGSKAFAKILDFSRALQEADTAQALNDMLDAYIFERSLLELCGKHGLTRVVRGLDYGELARSDVPLGKLFYIIFEMADGDVRRYMNDSIRAQLSWRFRVLHDVAVGLGQLHARKILHQDLKPSNVLIFEERDRSKLGDLGRAYCTELTAPHDGHRRPGAFYYAPPEQIYDHHFADRLAHRLAGDLYLLGSMLDFFVTGKPTTVRLIDRLQEVHRPFVVHQAGWRGFFMDVVPHLQAAHGELAADFQTQAGALIGSMHGSGALANELTQYYLYATNPDPMKRGHPGARATKHGSPYDLQRFIAAFEIISRRLAITEKVQSCKVRPEN